MKDPTRVYPIRMTRSEWNIPIYWNHQCSLGCNILDIVIEDDDSVRIVCADNSVCNHKGELERIFPRIISPAIYDNLYDPDTVVIPDSQFNILIHFPLNNPIDIRITYPGGNMTKKTLLNMIRTVYEDIYKEEEVTSTPHTYTIDHLCEKCQDKDISKNISKQNRFKNIEECCICNEKYTKNNRPVKIKCDHMFHEECIKTWSKRSPTCPMCRTNVIDCRKCKGNGYITFDLYCTVIPPELRDFRNQTDGVYGIYGFDMEDLIVRNMSYNRIKKRLYLDIGVPLL